MSADTGTVVLDSGALIALERREQRLLALLAELVRRRSAAHVPAGVVAQVWRGSPRQHDVGRLLSTRAVQVAPLSDDVARRLGLLLGVSHASDVVDAHVAFLGRRHGAPVVTSDPQDIRRIDPTLEIAPI